ATDSRRLERRRIAVIRTMIAIGAIGILAVTAMGNEMRGKIHETASTAFSYGRNPCPTPIIASHAIGSASNTRSYCSRYGETIRHPAVSVAALSAKSRSLRQTQTTAA